MNNNDLSNLTDAFTPVVLKDTILDFAVNTTTNVRACMIVEGTGYPEDAPAQNEAIILVLRGYGNRIIVFWIQYNTSSIKIYKRDIFNGSWYTSWNSVITS